MIDAVDESQIHTHITHKTCQQAQKQQVQKLAVTKIHKDWLERVM